MNGFLADLEFDELAKPLASILLLCVGVIELTKPAHNLPGDWLGIILLPDATRRKTFKSTSENC